MTVKSVVLTLVLCLVAAAVCFAADPFMGTWKLNESKSKIPPDVQKNHTVVYAPDGDNVKITVDGTDPSGKPAHNEWTGKFDGKEYPVTGDPNSDSRSYKKVNDHTLDMTAKKEGKEVMKGKIETSADGMSRTVTLDGKDSKGQKVHVTAVYDKQ